MLTAWSVETLANIRMIKDLWLSIPIHGYGFHQCELKSRLYIRCCNANPWTHFLCQYLDSLTWVQKDQTICPLGIFDRLESWVWVTYNFGKIYQEWHYLNEAAVDRTQKRDILTANYHLRVDNFSIYQHSELVCYFVSLLLVSLI